MEIAKLEVEELYSRVESFIRDYYHDELLRIARNYPQERRLLIDFKKLENFDFELSEEFLNNPVSSMDALKRVIKSFDLPIEKSIVRHAEIFAGFYNLPATHRLMIRNIRTEHVGRMISIKGIVRKATDVRPKIIEAAFECSKCGHVNIIRQEDETLTKPVICEACELKGSFKLVENESKIINFQKILVQEDLEDLRGGENPKQITCYLEEDLTDIAMPGDRVELTGVLLTRLQKKTRVLDIYLEPNYLNLIEPEFEEIKITKEEEEEIKKLAKSENVYELVRDSIAPHIYGFKEIKEAIMLQLFSSPAIIMPDGGRIRGDSHILIIGEPSTGKSEILQYIARELAPRGIYTAGKSATGAGLTATAVRDEFGEGGWSIEAGALVLADKGIACIDEFDKMGPEDRNAIHEAMEQQTVSVAKAGIVASFGARCAVLAAANPKFGRFDINRSIAEQINLTPTIISRFDLIFTVKDEPEETRNVAKHILDSVVSPEKASPPLSPEFLRKFIAYARQRCMPKLSKEARDRIEEYYVTRREQAKQAAIPLTARQLWAIIRLSRASARVRLSDVVTVEDAERAIKLLDISLRDVGIDVESGAIDIDKIMVGVTKSQRDKIVVIREIIRELEREFRDAAKEEIIEKAKEKGIEKREVEYLLEMLKKNQEIFEPRLGHYKLIE